MRQAFYGVRAGCSSNWVTIAAVIGGMLLFFLDRLTPGGLWVFLAMGEAPGQWALLGGVVVLIAMAVRYVMSARLKI